MVRYLRICDYYIYKCDLNYNDKVPEKRDSYIPLLQFHLMDPSHVLLAFSLDCSTFIVQLTSYLQPLVA